MKSQLMIHTVTAGTCEMVFETDDHIEAPNWAPDGTYLLFNGCGRLYQRPFAEPAINPVDTGAYDQLNNDHGISPDGKLIAFSDKSATGQSCIYAKAGGEDAARITKNVPSYWHGWSPDGGTLAYTAKRDGAFDIFTIPASGGEEMRLTRDMGHCDGPDYTPDGHWIWFNSDKSGSAQLWRMKTDGSELEQMTDDERVNWFPHPSPDGNVVVYLSYPEGTLGHPGNLNVELRLMPAEGGAYRTIVQLFGGQGTLNVPSWSPDSTRFAYVRYTKEEP